MPFRQFHVHSRNDCQSKESHSRISSQKGHNLSFCRNNNSRIREIKEEKKEPQILGSVTLANVYAVRENDTTNWQTKVKVTTKQSAKT